MIKILKTYFIGILAFLRLTILSSTIFSSTVHALNSDKDQPIDITADRLEMNEAKQINTYSGNVLLKQGSLNINADSLILFFDENNELDYMEMSGQPANLKQQNEEGEWMQGEAEIITYRDKESLLILKRKAKFKSGKEHISSDFIQINTDNEQIQAGNKNKQDRVHMKILPRSKQ